MVADTTFIENGQLQNISFKAIFQLKTVPKKVG